MDTYVAVVHKDDDSAYGAYIPDLVGCFAAGDTQDEALHNLRISLRIYAEDMSEAGQSLPRARPFRELMADSEVAQSISDGSGMLVMVPLIFADKKRRVNVTLEPSLIAAVDAAARISGTSRSDYLANAARRELEAVMGAVVVQSRKPRSPKRERVRTKRPRAKQVA